MVEGVNENSVAAIVRGAVASPAWKVTVCERSELPSQDCCWVMVTVATSCSVVSPVRVRVKFRPSSPAPMLSCCASMVTGTVAVVASRVTVTM